MKTQAFFLIFSLFACKAQKQSPPKDLIRVAIEDQPNSMDPRLAKGSSALHIVHLMTQSLVFLNKNLKAQGDLAESFQQTNPTTIVFKLRDDCFFHNGRKVNANDVIFSLDAFTQNSPYPIRPGIKNIKNYFESRPGEITISLSKPDPFFLDSDLSSIRILPKEESQQEGFASKPIGSGPFFVTDSYADRILLKRHPHYKTFENGIALKPIAFENIEVRFIRDSTSRFLALKSHQIDVLINQLTLAYTHELKSSKSFNTYQSPGATYHYLLINFKNAALQDKNFRQQLNQAIPKQRIIEKFFFNYATIAYSPLPSFLIPQEFQFLESKFEKIKSTSKIKLDILYEAGLENEAIIKEIKESWKTLEVELALTPLEKGVLLDRVDHGKFDLVLMKWSGISSPTILRRMLDSAEIAKGKNSGNYLNKKMDKALDKNDFKEALQIFQSDLPHFPLWFPDNLAVTNQSIVDFEWYPTGAWASFLHARRVE